MIRLIRKCFCALSLLIILPLIASGCQIADSKDSKSSVFSLLPTMVDLAMQDLSGKTGLQLSEIRVSSTEGVVFNDTSLGVVQPDESYAMVLTPGYIIKLEAGGTEYQYNTDNVERVVLYSVDEPNPQTETGSTREPETAFPSITMNPKEVKDGLPWRSVD